MATHNRGYYREQRQKHIERKKKIIKALNNYWHYDHEGMLSKGKIHCGCGMCRSKTNNKGQHRLIHGNYVPSKNWKRSDKRQIDGMDAAVAEYWWNESGFNPRVSNGCRNDFYDGIFTDFTLEEWLESLDDEIDF